MSEPIDGRVTLTEAAELGGQRLPAGAQLRLQGNQVFYNGQRLDLDLSTSDVHVPSELPTYLAGYPVEDYRAEEMAPEVLVDKDSDYFRTANTGMAFSPTTVKTDDKAAPNEVSFETSVTQYKVQPRRLASFIPDTVKAQAAPSYDVRFVQMELCKRLIALDIELDVMGPSGRGLLTTATNWDANNRIVLGLGTQWGGATGIGATSDPVRDIRSIQNKSATKIHKWIMNQRVAGLMLDNPAFRAFTRATIGDSPLAPGVRAHLEAGEGFIDFKIPGLGTFCVCCAKWKDPTGSTIDYVMPDVVVALHLPPGLPVNAMTISTAKNFRRRGAYGVGYGVREVRIETRGAGGSLLIVEEASSPTMTSTLAGGIITGINQ